MAAMRPRAHRALRSGRQRYRCSFVIVRRIYWWSTGSRRWRATAARAAISGSGLLDLKAATRLLS
jgi:hypothetical protein